MVSEEQQEINIALLQNDMNYIREDIREIKSNHLPHIYKSLQDGEKRFDKIEKNLAKYAGAIIFFQALITIGLIVAKLFF